MKSIITLLVALSLLDGTLYASGPFTITPPTYPSTVPTAVQTVINAQLSALETEVNAKLPKSDASKYPPGIANSNVVATKGLGVDYTNDFDLFVVGMGIGLGADAGGSSPSGGSSVNSYNGVAMASTLMGGLNLRFFHAPKLLIDWSKVKFYVNAMSQNFPKFSSDVSGSMNSLGVHAQYEILAPITFFPFLLRWGGVEFTTGFDKAGMDFRYSKALTESSSTTTSIDLGAGVPVTTTITGTYTGTARVNAKSNIYTIPLEVSSSVQFLYLFTLFGGLGADYNWGKTTLDASADGSIALSESTGTIPSLTAIPNFYLGNEGKPTSFTSRGFLGLQFNLSALKVYLQYNQVFGGAFGAVAGARIAW